MKLALLLWVASVSGAELGRGPWTLADCLEKAAAVSPTRGVAKARLARAEQAYRESLAAFLPSASLNGRWRPLGHDEAGLSDDRFSHSRVRRDYQLSGTWNLFRMGNDLDERRIADLERRDRVEDEDDTRQAVELAALRAFFGVLTSSRTYAVRENDLRTSQRNEKLTRGLYDEGVVGYPELLNAQLQLSLSRQSLIRARFADDSARLALNILLDREPLAPISLLEPKGEARAGRGLENAVQTAFETRSDWKRARFAVDIADLRRRVAWRAVLPEFSADLSLARDLDRAPGATGDATTYELDLTVDIPLFDGFRDLRRFRAAEAGRRLATEEQGELERRIRTEVATAFLRLRQNRSLREEVEAEAKAAAERLRLVTDLFREGRSSSEFLQQAQDRLLRAQTRDVELFYEGWVLRAEMESAMGMDVTR